MKSFYHAYQCYENRAARGEFDRLPAPNAPRKTLSNLLEVQLGNFLINAGLKLKRRTAAGKSMAWSPLTGSKQ
jgi:hypothetical protein